MNYSCYETCSSGTKRLCAHTFVEGPIIQQAFLGFRIVGWKVDEGPFESQRTNVLHRPSCHILIGAYTVNFACDEKGLIIASVPCEKVAGFSRDHH